MGKQIVPRSKSTVNGQVRAGENTYNQMVSSLQRARQFNRFSAARGSRLHSWMSSQVAFADRANAAAASKGDQEPAFPCSTFRPISDANPQDELLSKTEGDRL